eukprot:scaffold229587_cov18-Tisochrysis_lutea.AAC.2
MSSAVAHADPRACQACKVQFPHSIHDAAWLEVNTIHVWPMSCARWRQGSLRTCKPLMLVKQVGNAGVSAALPLPHNHQ